MTQTNVYNPDEWLTSTVRALKEYVDNNFNEAYLVIMEYPSTDKMIQMMPLTKTIVHFEIDAIDDKVLGFGENIGDYNYDTLTQQSAPQEAGLHVINFDVGVWASDRSGGITSRLRARQTLTQLFYGSSAQKNLSEAVNAGDGTIEITNFTGGRFLTDKINDVDIYRMVDFSIDVRVFSRTPLPSTPYDTIQEILQDPQLTIPN